MLDKKRTFVIGDLHGHLDRFEALLRQEGLLSPTDERLLRDEVEVVLVGDIGHWGKGGSPTGDLMTLKAAVDWADVILWGNHDYALFNDAHAFRGLQKPQGPEYKHLWKLAEPKLAYAAHGYLITHAGLAYAFKNQRLDEFESDADPKDSPEGFARWINCVADPESTGSPSQLAVRDAIGAYRGGASPVGGILWRDINEKLYDRFPQVFGHTADHKKGMIRTCNKSMHTRDLAMYDEGYSFCIDVGSADNGALAGIYLPDLITARVDL